MRKKYVRYPHMRLLLVEDEEKLARFIKRGLEAEGYTVDTVTDGNRAVGQIQFGDYDAVILDVMLPGKDGIEITRSAREKGNNVPILILTAKDALEDKIAGLEAGADDYLTKPFAFAELKARVHALLRRRNRPVKEVLSHKQLRVDTLAHRVYLGETEIPLTLKEYAVLEYLLLHKGQVLTRDQILDHCWGYDFDSFSNIVDVYIKRVRKKLREYSDETFIETVRGVGYRIAE